MHLRWHRRLTFDRERVPVRFYLAKNLVFICQSISDVKSIRPPHSGRARLGEGEGGGKN